MAAVNYTTELDSTLANAVTDTSISKNIIKSLSTAPTFTDKFKVVQALALKYPTNLSIVDAATQWLKDNSGDLYDPSTYTYLSDGVYRNALLEADTKGKPLNKLFTKINQLRTDNVSNALKETAPDLSKTEFDTAVTNLTNGSKTVAYDPTKYIATASKGTPAVAYKKGMTADQLKTNYGSLIDPTTKKPVFTSQYLDDVANGVASASAFNKKVNSLATDAVNKSQDWSLYGGKTGSAYVSAIKNMVSDPSKLATVYKAPAVTDTSVKGGSGIDELTTPITTTGAKTGQVPSLKTWKAPQQPKDGVYTATANSPYSGLLDSILSKVTGTTYGDPTINERYKNLTDPLTQGMGLDSLPKPKLIYDTADTAGITGLGDVKGTLQSLNTQVTSTPSYNQNQIANANTALDNAAAVAGKNVIGDNGLSGQALIDWQTQSLAKEKADYFKLHPDQDPVKLAAQGEANRLAVEQSVAQRQAAEQAAALKKDADEKAAFFASHPGVAPPADKPQTGYVPPVNTNIGGFASPDNLNSSVGVGVNTLAPQFTSGDYIPPANRTVPAFANNPALAGQIAWSATQDAAQAKQAAPAVGINSLGQQVINPGTSQVLDASGVPIPGKRNLFA